MTSSLLTGHLPPVVDAPRARRYHLKTFGCQMNLADSAGMADVLEARGFEPTGDPKDADLVLVNTCTVREKAEEKAFSYLGQLDSLARRRASRKRPPLHVGLVGCLTNQVRDSIQARFPSIAFALSPDGIEAFDAELVRLWPDAHRVEVASEFAADGAYLTEITGRAVHGVYAQGDRHRFVNVMRGCEKMCTFCIVPFARGGNFSYPIEQIRGQIERYLMQDGAKVITLLGQSILDYGKDRPVREGGTPQTRGDHHFRELLVEVATCYPNTWFKFLTSHPHDLTRETVDAIAELPNVTRYFHLPLQAGDNEVLRRMGRRYSYEQYREKIGWIREAMPDARISTDLITGFVGETEAQFERTLAACEELQFDKAFTFYYTTRPGTYADDHWPDTLTEGEKKERLARLIEVCNGITLTKHRSLVGTRMPVLVEGAAQREAGQVVGRSKEEDVVVFAGEIGALLGRVVEVSITGGNLRTLTGTLHGTP